MPDFTPNNWFWQVGADTTRWFSSAAKAYVTTLPKDAGVTKIKDEAELLAVLQLQYPAGIPDIKLPELDLAKMNAALIEPGSVVRALGLVLFNTINAQNLVTLDAINELRVKAALQPYTVAQFRAALAAKQGQNFYTMTEFLDALQAQMR